MVGRAAMELARLDMLAMLGTREGAASDSCDGAAELGAEGDETLDLLIHFSMWPFSTSRLLNFLPQSWQG